MTFNTGLSRDGPGLLARDIAKGDADATLQLLVQAAPDIAVLQDVDYDHDKVALGLLTDRLKALGLDLPYRFANPPNTGRDSGHDLDRNGKLGEPRDMQGYGRFSGQGGMAVLSRYPIVAAVDLSDTLWRDVPDPGLPQTQDGGFYSDAVLGDLRLHSVAAWDVTLRTPGGPLHVLTSHASTPVFDGPENRNGLRNAAELRFWADYVSGMTPDQPAVLLGDFNNDLTAGEGLRPALRAVLNHPKLQHPQPKGVTAEWASGLRLTVDYVLPSRHFGVAGAQVERTPLRDDGPRHHPVWVDIVWK